MELYKYSSRKVLLSVLGILYIAEVANGGESCTYSRNGSSGTVYCEYGCCGTDEERECCGYTVSTSILIVAGVVGGLVAIALVSSVIVCCVKKYKDKQESRVRELHHSQRRAHVVHVRRGPAAVPKPPTYTEAPPAYSSEMPESHFRPFTVSGQYGPYNQRFNTPYPTTTTTTSRTTSGSVGQTVQASNQSFQTSTSRARAHATISTATQPAVRNVLFTGPIQEPPPPYREYERGRTPANTNRRRRFIPSPGRNTSNAGASSDTNRTNTTNAHPNGPVQTVQRSTGDAAAAQTVQTTTGNATAARSGNVAAAPPAVARSSRIPTRTQNSTLSTGSNANHTPQTVTASVTTATVVTSQRTVPTNTSAVTSENVTVPSVARQQNTRPVVTAAPQSSSGAPARGAAPPEPETQQATSSGQQSDNAQPSRTLALLHARIASRRETPATSSNTRHEIISDIDDLACL